MISIFTLAEAIFLIACRFLLLCYNIINFQEEDLLWPKKTPLRKNSSMA